MESIFILRHGKAEDLNESQSKNDFDRKLTEEGRKKTKKLGIFFNTLEENIDLVLSSPYIRAKETAEIFVSSLDPKPEFKIVDFLSSGSSCKEISKGLSDYFSYNKALIVGHAPDLEIFLGKLMGAENIKFKKGALAKVTLNSAINLSGELEWMVTSAIIKKIKLEEKDKSLSDKADTINL